MLTWKGMFFKNVENYFFLKVYPKMSSSTQEKKKSKNDLTWLTVYVHSDISSVISVTSQIGGIIFHCVNQYCHNSIPKTINVTKERATSMYAKTFFSVPPFIIGLHRNKFVVRQLKNKMRNCLRKLKSTRIHGFQGCIRERAGRHVSS